MVLGCGAQSLLPAHTAPSFHPCILKERCPLESSHWYPSRALCVTLRGKSSEGL